MSWEIVNMPTSVMNSKPSAPSGRDYKAPKRMALARCSRCTILMGPGYLCQGIAFLPKPPPTPSYDLLCYYCVQDVQKEQLEAPISWLLTPAAIAAQGPSYATYFTQAWLRATALSTLEQVYGRRNERANGSHSNTQGQRDPGKSRGP